MKQILSTLMALVTWLSACAPSAEPLPPVQTEIPVTAIPTPQGTATDPVPVPTEAMPAPKLPAPSFEAQTYINETAGFALEYPDGWTVNEQTIGPRGSQVQFLSSPELADVATLPQGATRVSATVNQWDPQNDLAAYVAQRKTAWQASGFTILEEEQLVLELGLPAVRFTIQTPEATAIFLIAALGDQYLVLSGEGDLELVKEIVQRVRPISVK